MTPEFKREWQLLRMRGLLDPKHQKKALRVNAPEYSQIGEVVAGPTDFYSSRLTRKERKNTILEEVLDTVDKQKFQVKYAGIQRDKTSGKKGFYKKLVSQRRKRQNWIECADFYLGSAETPLPLMSTSISVFRAFRANDWPSVLSSQKAKLFLRKVRCFIKNRMDGAVL